MAIGPVGAGNPQQLLQLLQMIGMQPPAGYAGPTMQDYINQHQQSMGPSLSGAVPQQQLPPPAVPQGAPVPPMMQYGIPGGMAMSPGVPGPLGPKDQSQLPGGGPQVYQPPNIEYLPEATPDGSAAPTYAGVQPGISAPGLPGTPAVPPMPVVGDPQAAPPIGGPATPSPAPVNDKMSTLMQALAGLSAPPQRPPVGVSTPPPPRPAAAPTDILSMVLAMGGMAPRQGPRLGG